MKKTVPFILFVLLITVVSCDKIKNPNKKPAAVYNCIDTLTQVVRTNTATSGFKKVLLEDYTGHYCQNCPRAAEAAEALETTYGNKLVVIANHVSTNFAQPNPNPNDTTYKVDFRNAASTAWDVQYGMSFPAGLPQGAVNRMGSPNYAQAYSKWSSSVSTALQTSQVAKLDVTSYYDTLKHYITVRVKTTFLTALTNNVNLSVLLTQDSLKGEQKDGQPPPGAQVSPVDPSMRVNYRFDNVVIGSINDPLGQLVKAGPIAAKDTVTSTNTCYLLGKCFETIPRKVCVNDKYVNLVAFIFDATTNEVLQVEKLRIK
jgi:hypothetical protein